jgi:hypothetical protein
LAERADTAERRKKLLELSRVWMEAALREDALCRVAGPEPIS